MVVAAAAQGGGGVLQTVDVLKALSSTPVGVRTVCNLISRALCVFFSLALDVNKLNIVFRRRGRAEEEGGGQEDFEGRKPASPGPCTAVA